MSKKLEKRKSEEAKSDQQITPENVLAYYRSERSDEERQVAEAVEYLMDRVGGRKIAAKIMGVNVNTLDNYRAGHTQPRILELRRLSEAAQTTLGAVFDSQLVSQVILPRYEIRAAAGRGALVVSENVADHFAVSADWLRRQLPSWAPPNAVVGILEGGGDSMEPTIRDGDLIMLVRDPPPHVIERGGIFVFTLDQDRLLLKRLQVLMNGDLSIISDNPAYVTETIPRDQIDSRVIVHGQIFFAGGRPRTLAR